MGGRIAWRFAADRPERVRRLVLMAPDGLASHGLEYDKPARVPLLLNLLPYVLPTPLLRATLANAYADPAKLRPQTLELYRDMILAPGVRRAVLDRTRGHVLDRPEPILARITAPVLLLWGEQDRMVPLSAAPVFQAALRNERLVALPGLGHVPMEEDPERALVPVRQFLGE
jgi:pimeloyl-ACP methyl ester carboxylesterase